MRHPRAIASPLFVLSLATLFVWGCTESTEESSEQVFFGTNDVQTTPSNDLASFPTEDTGFNPLKDTSTDSSRVSDVSQDSTTAADSALQDTAQSAPDTTQPSPDVAQPPTSACGKLGLEEKPFQAGQGGVAFGDVAGDFTLDTLDGPWTFSEGWTGCDSYVFVSYFEGATGDQIWASNPANLFANSPKNVHYFFAVYTVGDKLPLLDTLKFKIDAVIAQMTPEDAEWWSGRVHYVTTDPFSINGSMGGYYATLLPNVIFLTGIDRSQRFDAPSSLGLIQAGGFKSDLQMAAYSATYYNFLYEQETKAAAETVDLATLFDNALITENNGIHPITFPDAQTMATYDTMTLDIQARCGPNPTDCGEWDYEAFLQLCSDPQCTSHNEVGLWVTPYARPGIRRWLVDATPFLGLVKDGGQRYIRFGMLWNMNPNTMTVRFRLSNKGVGLRPVAVEPLFQGGEFNASYNAKYQPYTFTPPATTKKVELVTLLTGHGQEPANNCAEWCNHVHTFKVNGTPFIKTHVGQPGQPFGCADQVSEGVVPGQYGNWAPSRAYWCPGLPVAPWRQDITGSVNLNAPNTMTYAGSYLGGAPAGGRVRLSSYLVYYE